ncbi:MAG: hypothetical protein ACM3TR_16600 [Caulobacteraceae bacterium]
MIRLWLKKFRTPADYTLVAQEKIKSGGQEYVKVVYKDSDYIYEDRVFIKNNKVYELNLETEDVEKYKKSTELTALLDSFKPEFVKNGKTEDPSDVTSDGYRVYEDKKLKFSIKIPADWSEPGDSDKENEITFSEPSKDNETNRDMIKIYMYSIEKGLTFDKWIDDELRFFKEECNPELVKLLRTEDTNINGVRAKKLLYSMQAKNRLVYVQGVYVFGKNYRYEIDYVTSKNGSDPEVLNKINSILTSFKNSEPDAAEIGSFIDPRKIGKVEGVRKIENKDYKFSFEVPADWVELSLGDKSTASYMNKDKTMDVMIIARSGITEEQYIGYYVNTLVRTMTVTGNFVNHGMKTFTEKDVKITMFDITITLQDMEYKKQYYILSKNGYVYEITLDISSLYSSDKNMKILKNIWDSIKFE